MLLRQDAATSLNSIRSSSWNRSRGEKRFPKLCARSNLPESLGDIHSRNRHILVSIRQKLLAKERDQIYTGNIRDYYCTTRGNAGISEIFAIREFAKVCTRQESHAPYSSGFQRKLFDRVNEKGRRRDEYHEIYLEIAIYML